MKKIAIITLIGWVNYGNRLQNYSLQNFLENNFDIDVKTIQYPVYSQNKISHRRKIIRIVNFVSTYRTFLSQVRFTKLREFDKYIKYDKNYYIFSDTDKLNCKYDYFIVGSDQVWNCDDNFRSYLLPNIDKSKKISYAASIARTAIKTEEEYFFEKYLDTFKGVSVREQDSIETIQKFTKNEVNSHIDPVFLTSAKEWEQIEKSVSIAGKKDYILEIFLSGKNQEYNDIIENISKKYGLKRINIFKKALRPEEFIYLIHNAKMVFTDSFHAVVFSIIFKRPFINLKRLCNDDMSLRFKNLEKIFNTKFITIDDLKNNLDDNSLLEFKIINSDLIIQKEKERSIEYFTEMFKDEKSYNNLSDKDFFCTGCGLCKTVCPVNAIDYIVNDEGFIEKKIDNDKCIHCGLCLKNCPALKNFDKLDKNNVYILNRKNNIEDKSSSAGVFLELSKIVLSQGGVVFGAEYNKDDNIFIKIENVEDLYKIQGSKYYQFNCTKIYDDVKNILETNRKVLICGTPCQIAGFYQKFGDNENLILVQIICHGVPSKKMFDDCCIEQFNKKPDDINFRYHHPSWNNFSVKYTSDNENKIILQKDDLFMRIFLSDVALNNCCYNCHFVGNKTGADIIIGDCWGVNQIDKRFYSKNGVSIVKINTEKGNDLFNIIENNFNKKLISQKKIKFCNSNLFNSYYREKVFFKKAKFYSIRKKGSCDSLADCFNQTNKVVVGNKYKQFVKKVIYKLIKY